MLKYNSIKEEFISGKLEAEKKIEETNGNVKYGEISLDLNIQKVMTNKENKNKLILNQITEDNTSKVQNYGIYTLFSN